MMYEVYIYNVDNSGKTQEKLLYYPNDDTYEIVNSKLELALNEAGSFEFDIPSTNLCYDDFRLRHTMVKVLQNGSELFYGEVREVTQKFDFTKHVYAVGELAFLFDSIQPQKKYQMSPLQMFQSLLNQHNAQVEARKQFSIGTVSVTDSNNYIYRYTNREDTLTALRGKMCDSLNGYLRVRKDSSGKRYLDLVPLANYGTYCKQEIQFGENLIDYACNMTVSDIATVCIPLGAKLDEDKRTSAAVENLDEYLTIVGQPADTYHKKKTDDFVQNDSAIANYGYVRVVKKWDDVTDASNLKKKAIDWLKSAQYETMTLELNAFDLSLMDANIDSFDVGDTVHAWALPFGMDTTFPVQKKTIYLNELEKNSIVLGSSVQRSYTSQASKAVNDLADTIPETSPILENAKNNALRLLNGQVGGHVIMQFDSTNSYVEQMLICNASTEAKSTQKWVWNLNGLGYMHRNNINSAWTSLDVAITMDGHMVANFITSGLLRLTGVNTSTDSTSGTRLQVYDKNTLIGSWGSNGISVTKGSIKLGLQDDGKTYNFTVNDAGTVAIRKGSINLGVQTDGSYNFSATDNGTVTIKKGSMNINDGQFKVGTDGSVTIKAGSININGNTFKVDSSGKLTCSNAEVKGKVQATSGYIGKDSGTGWTIGEKAIYSGCTGVMSTTNGTYVGVDGIRSQKDGNYCLMYNGAMSTNTSLQAKNIGATTISGDVVNASKGGELVNVKIVGGELAATKGVFEGDVYGKINVKVNDTYTRGQSTTWTIQSRDGNYHSLMFQDGILVGSS